ncbi:Predicted flavoprotein CzcO associated with the cation diffusion facilitator CzcD [Actinokineospora alba]|uniref:Predicted flavoprotein CzcO associated with the cation diffusion facilitator CzcD n=1 Tax=Actinokineospora alba TaxID=504798 RepID=A0A1H0VKJ6_9PSEU|nr:NAD(P)/FAD-dependent oxidoreductase [Actinokineospora alba]TDP67674.1 cation diffusion facilitator CzcD-associated flavoprotein CzcO [Actinokineospora alba]SDJ28685.1 Predicted flavoprotein CzcO associated with the cation diffusion facilitator CzcD [Actinokineospora alba]SDP78715.1 Predicted flavoprotein CzcO associated with the cation diffusion facilitator CzcD [Actinokineospora alba]
MGELIHTNVVVIGTGFSGMGMAIQLRREGRDDFVILEKAADFGGTWRDNSYPGCACDIQSHMYSFSFEQKSDWTRSYAPQAEIWDYMRGVAAKWGLARYTRFGVEVTSARWDEEESRWYVGTASGDTYVGKYLVAGIGALHIPSVPALPGIENFQGATFHSAQWDHDYDLKGKRVAVIGTGASAIQFVPKIAPDVAELTLFQRTAPWVMPKPDHAMPAWSQALFAKAPGVQRGYRHFLYWINEVRAVGFNGHQNILKFASKLAAWNIKRSVKDPELARKLTPDYVMGCKRVLVSNDYYPTFNRPNVHLDTDGVAEVRANSIVGRDGREHQVDAIIYGTGFHVTDAFDYLTVSGRDGRDLAKEWRENGINTHLGITVSGYPNLFYLLGPNTGLGHNSVVFMIESQIRYIADALRLVEKHGADAIDVRATAQERFNQEVQRKLADGVWTQGGCQSWYLDAKGVNRTIWPGFTWRYWMRTRKVDPADFELITRGKVKEPADTAAAVAR